MYIKHELGWLHNAIYDKLKISIWVQTLFFYFWKRKSEVNLCFNFKYLKLSIPPGLLNFEGFVEMPSDINEFHLKLFFQPISLEITHMTFVLSPTCARWCMLKTLLYSDVTLMCLRPLHQKLNNTHQQIRKIWNALHLNGWLRNIQDITQPVSDWSQYFVRFIPGKEKKWFI